MKTCKFPWVHSIVEARFRSPDRISYLERYCTRCYQREVYKRINNKWVLTEYLDPKSWIVSEYPDGD